MGEARRDTLPAPSRCQGPEDVCLHPCCERELPEPAEGCDSALPGGSGCFSLSGLRSRFPVLPFDLVSHGPGAGLPQRRNSRLRDGVMSFFQRTCWPGWQWIGLFFLVPMLLLPSGRQVLERAWSGDAAKASCRWENPGPSAGSGTKPGLSVLAHISVRVRRLQSLPQSIGCKISPG